MFTWRGARAEPLALAGLEADTVMPSSTEVRTDFELHAYHHGGQVHMVWLYDRDLFEASRFQPLADRYVALLDAMSGAPLHPIHQLP